MASPPEKITLQRNIYRALRLRPGLSEMEDKQAVTQLKKLGLVTGHAQRLLDENSSPQLSSIIEVSKRLRVPVADLFRPDADDNSLEASPPPWPLGAFVTPARWELLSQEQRAAVAWEASKVVDKMLGSDATPHSAPRKQANGPR